MGLTGASYPACPSRHAQRLAARPSRLLPIRGYYSGEEIVACEQAGVRVYLPKPMTSGINAKGRFGKQDFVYVAADDVYLCPAGEQLCSRALHRVPTKLMMHPR